MWQALGDAIVNEFITIEPRQAIRGAEPEEATRIGNDLVDLVTCKPLRGGVSANRKLFGAALRDCNEQYENRNDSLHGGVIIATNSHHKKKKCSFFAFCTFLTALCIMCFLWLLSLS